MNDKLNKILGSILFVAFVILLSSNLVEIIYNSINDTSKRGHIFETNQEEENIALINNNTDKVPSWDIPELLKVASKENGQKIFNQKCKTCHNIIASEGNKVGPNLSGVINRIIGSKEGFNYSKMLLQFKSEQKAWTEQNFFNYINSPKRFAPGGRMAFAGIKKGEEIADLLFYMQSAKD